MTGYDVFISYRRKGGKECAEELYNRLTEFGLSVFMDKEELHFGDFRKQLHRNNRLSRHLLVVLSPGALDRCKNKGDWVRIEIASALRQGKKIVPVYLDGFEFPDDLPKELQRLKKIPPIRYAETHYPNFAFKFMHFASVFTRGWSRSDLEYIRTTRKKYEEQARGNLLDDWGDCTSQEDAFFDDYRDETAVNTRDNRAYILWIFAVVVVGLILLDTSEGELYVGTAALMLCCQLLIMHVKKKGGLATIQTAKLLKGVGMVVVAILAVVGVSGAILLGGIALTDLVADTAPEMVNLIPMTICATAKGLLLYNLLAFAEDGTHWLNARTCYRITTCLRRKRRLELTKTLLGKCIIITVCVVLAFMAESYMALYVPYQWFAG